MTIRRSLRRTCLPVLIAAMLTAACKDDPPETLLASARDYLERHDNRAAVIQIKNALQKKPDLPEARFLLGQVFLEEGEYVSAELELRKALEFDYAADRAVPLLARAVLGQGKADKVLEQFADRKLATAENQADLLTSVGVAHAARGNAKAGMAALEQALKLQPEYIPAMVAEARIKAISQDYGGALARIDPVLQKAPDNYEAWKLKGDVLMTQGQPEEGAAAYRKALELKPDLIPAHAALISGFLHVDKLDAAGEQVEVMRKVAPKHPLTLYLDALVKFRQGDMTAARDLAQRLVLMYPNNPEALQLAGMMEFQHRVWDRAEGYLSKALQMEPGLRMARRFLLGTYMEAGQPGKALATLEPVLGAIDKDPQMLALAGQIYLQNGDIQKAEDYFSRAAALDPEDAGKRTHLAIARMMKGDVDLAFGELEKIAATDTGTAADLALISFHLRRNQADKALEAIAALEKKQPNSPLVHELRGRSLLAKGDGEGARKSFGQALAAKPTYFPAVADLARLDLAEKKPEEAAKRFQAVLDADPKNSQAQLALAEMRRRAGATPGEIAALIAKAVAMDPGASAPRIALINHYLQDKDAAKAVASAQDAVAAMPDRPELLAALAVAQKAAGNANQALASYTKLAAVQPGWPMVYLRMAEIHQSTGNDDGAIQVLRHGLQVKPVTELAIKLHFLLANRPAGGSAEAEKFARGWLHDHPKDGAFQVYLAERATSRQDFETAAQHYRAVLAFRPDDVGILNNLAWVLGQRHHPQALEYAEKANRLAPNQPAVMDTLAVLLAEKGNRQRALELLHKAVEKAPNAPLIRLNYAMVLIQAGNKAAARKELQELAKLGEKFPRQAEVERLLRDV